MDPQFGTAGHNYVYVNYTYNRDPRDTPRDRAEVVDQPGPAVRRLPVPGRVPQHDRVPDHGARVAPRRGRHPRGLGPAGRGAATGRGRLLPVPQPRVGRRADRTRRLPLRLDGRRGELHLRGLRAGQQPVSGRPGRRGRVAAQPGPPYDGRRGGPRRLDHPDQPGERHRRRRQRRQRRADRRLRAAQPVAADLPARHHRAVVGRRRRQRVGGDQPARDQRAQCAGQPGVALLRGHAQRLGPAARLGRAEQAGVREPVRRRGRRRRRRRTSATRPEARCSPPASSARAARRRSPVSRSRRRAATGPRPTRARCSSPTTPARACGGWARSPTATPTRPASRRSSSRRRPRSSWSPARRATCSTSTTAWTSSGVPEPGAGGIHRIAYLDPAPGRRPDGRPHLRTVERDVHLQRRRHAPTPTAAR